MKIETCSKHNYTGTSPCPDCFPYYRITNSAGGEIRVPSANVIPAAKISNRYFVGLVAIIAVINFFFFFVLFCELKNVRAQIRGIDITMDSVERLLRYGPPMNERE